MRGRKIRGRKGREIKGRKEREEEMGTPWQGWQAKQQGAKLLVLIHDF
jgi:hypothetical protein